MAESALIIINAFIVFGSIILFSWIRDTSKISIEIRQRNEFVADIVNPLESSDAAILKLRQRGWLEDGSLQGVDLAHANLENADLSRALLTNANLLMANLVGAKLDASRLDFANLAGANLTNARMHEASLKGSSLRAAKLNRAILQGVDFAEADLETASLVNANLRNSRLIGVRFERADLLHADIEDAVFDESTVLPDGMRWTRNTDLTRYTDPSHPNFWRPVAKHVHENPIIRDEMTLLPQHILQARLELQDNNYTTAYREASRALELSPDNSLANFYAGWLEMHYVPGRLNEGLAHLQRALELDPDSPPIMAAYGIGLRRRARQITDQEERQRLSLEAEVLLRRALALEPTLVDLNRESFWGPLAGLQRDQGRFEEAVRAYEQAARITPGSSYPRGNLASLYLRRLREKPDDRELERLTIDTFADTLRLAQVELSLAPNDYFHAMDIAMAAAVLSSRSPDEYAPLEFQRMLDEALAMQPTPEMLRVSLRGWELLIEYCPEDWTDLRQQLEVSIERLRSAISDKQD